MAGPRREHFQHLDGQAVGLAQRVRGGNGVEAGLGGGAAGAPSVPGRPGTEVGGAAAAAGGYTGVPDQGSIYYYMYGGAYSGLSGAEGEKAQQLDRRFTQLKVPIARAAMAVGGALMVFSSALIVVGVVRLPWRFPALLIVECILDAVVAVGLLFALYYFFHHLLGVYDSSVCKERAQLYQSKGYRGFSCSMHGAEIAAGLLGCAAVVAFLLGAGLAIRGYRIVHKLKQKPEHAYEP